MKKPELREREEERERERSFKQAESEQQQQEIQQQPYHVTRHESRKERCQIDWRLSFAVVLDKSASLGGR